MNKYLVCVQASRLVLVEAGSEKEAVIAVEDACVNKCGDEWEIDEAYLEEVILSAEEWSNQVDQGCTPIDDL